MTFTVEQLKTDAETILADAGFLGSYSGLSASPVPAVAILPDDSYGFNYPPASVTVDKIELVVFKPEYTHQLTFGTDLIERANHRLCLKQWETVDPNTQTLKYPPRLREAGRELFQQLNLKGYELEPPIFAGKDEKLGTLETCYFLVYCTDLVCIS